MAGIGIYIVKSHSHHKYRMDKAICNYYITPINNIQSLLYFHLNLYLY